MTTWILSLSGDGDRQDEGGMNEQMRPKARQSEGEGIVIRDLDDETLVYDLRRHRAHCLNRTASFLWRRCDGETAVSDLSAALTSELGTPADERVVWLALRQLDRAQLFTERLPAGGEPIT